MEIRKAKKQDAERIREISLDVVVSRDTTKNIDYQLLILISDGHSIGMA